MCRALLLQDIVCLYFSRVILFRVLIRVYNYTKFII
jgi:hypothetical protein